MLTPQSGQRAGRTFLILSSSRECARPWQAKLWESQVADCFQKGAVTGTGCCFPGQAHPGENTALVIQAAVLVGSGGSGSAGWTKLNGFLRSLQGLWHSGRLHLLSKGGFPKEGSPRRSQWPGFAVQRGWTGRIRGVLSPFCHFSEE